jgi:hypothetical protein
MNIPPLEIGIGEVSNTFICAMPPGGAVSLETRIVVGNICAVALAHAARLMQNVEILRTLNPRISFCTSSFDVDPYRAVAKM